MKHTVIIILGVTLLGLAACGEKAPPKAPPKAQKISVPSSPAANPTGSQAQKDVTPAEKQSAATNAPDDATGVEGAGDAGANATSDLVKDSLQIVSSYNPEDRFDPFAPLFKERIPAENETPTKEKSKRRIPQTPLERIALGQLKLTAIIRAPSGNRGMVIDATGKGYVVENGTYIGLNSGQVVEITNDRIVVEEEIENIMGELRLQKSELKIQKPAGEF